MATILMRNSTVGDLEFSFGDTIKAGETDDYSHMALADLARSLDLLTAIAAAEVVVSDGTTEMAPAAGDAYIRGLYVKATNMDVDGVTTTTVAATDVTTETVTAKEITVTTEGGTTLLEVDPETGGMALNGFKFPVADGLAGQAMFTDGAKALFFDYVKDNRLHAEIPVAYGTTIIPKTLPAITDGTEIWTGQFTKKKADSVVDILVSVPVGDKDVDQYALTLWRDSTLIGGAVTIGMSTLSLQVEDDLLGSAARTYSIRVGFYNKRPKGATWVSSNVKSDNLWGILQDSSTINIKESYK